MFQESLNLQNTLGESLTGKGGGPEGGMQSNEAGLEEECQYVRGLRVYPGWRGLEIEKKMATWPGEEKIVSSPQISLW